MKLHVADERIQKVKVADDNIGIYPRKPFMGWYHHFGIQIPPNNPCLCFELNNADQIAQLEVGSHIFLCGVGGNDPDFLVSVIKNKIMCLHLPGAHFQEISLPHIPRLTF